ncbi:MAG: protein phosphatase CheZ [Hyphomicrobiales bacterium]
MPERSRKLFKIETYLQPGDEQATGTGGFDPRAADRHDEIMAEFAAIRRLLAAGTSATDQNVSQTAALLSELRRELSEASKMKTELDAITDAIDRTKLEIATLHQTNFDSTEMGRVTDQLDAIVLGTEKATESILAAAEVIDEHAGNLHAKLSGDDQGMASDMQDAVVRIFEACNFQDLTGQRISKVVRAMHFVEERVERMIQIWGGIDSFSGIDGEKPAEAEGDHALLNGPALDDDAGRASQDEIDALFA